MAERQDEVRRHYGSAALVDKLLAELKTRGLAPDKLTAETLFPYDQLHGRELAATREHIGRLALASGKKVLDVGSGIGGPSRFVAATTGATVDGVGRSDAALPTGCTSTRAMRSLCRSAATISTRRSASTWR
ncbi:MAG TPA: hypothetical protein VMT54_02330 [Candidatus Cybelea sp.]|nr:hypothetical protein [Candidatus Cybelea sp.]